VKFASRVVEKKHGKDSIRLSKEGRGGEPSMDGSGSPQRIEMKERPFQ